MKEKGVLAPGWALVVHVVVGGLQFTAIMLVAVGVAALVKGFEYLGIAPEWLVRGAGVVEQGIFWFDVFVFALYLLAEAITFVGRLWSNLKPVRSNDDS